ncbi:VanZ family protein [Algoriphagus hitonicola]|uniref:VanZ like family protein n=1 Tax=Algoriphagus hitonicola TaxID=435880 RepID=A0A1I2P0C8_9BACT|nr:VanZ family protein [Algoriphagus hitonicola]SFG09448.1 VanZ like family protein [Algoriphagus hitonicola]
MRLTASILWLILLGFAMLTPGDRFPEVNAFDYQDKFIHLICFFLLAYLWAGVFKKQRLKDWNRLNWAIFILLGFLPGVFFETAQLFIRNRSFDEYDLIVNLLGGILGILAYFKTPSIPSLLH